MRKVWVLSLLLLAVFSIAGCSKTPASADLEDIHWQLYGVWVDDKGTVQEAKGTAELSFTASLPTQYEPQSIIKGSAEFTLPDGITWVSDSDIYSIYANLATEHDNQHIYHISGYVEYAPASPESVAFTVSLEDEFVIMSLKNGENLYLVASTDPNADPAEIFAFYDTYVHVPESE